MRNPFQRALFWMTFLAAYFETSRTWSDLFGHLALGHHGPPEIANMALVVLVTLHLLWGGRDHG
jgi:hypothetical protein